jgi:Fe-S-cluster-containing hydrogenase component 2
VTGVVIGAVGPDYQLIPGTEKHFEADTICLAVGLSPMSQLADMAGCAMEDNPCKAGYVPVVDDLGETSVSGIFAAGDVSGIEEASSAMIEGRIAGVAAAWRLGFIDRAELDAQIKEMEPALDSLRQGMFAPGSRGKKIEKTDEGCDISDSLLKYGFIAEDEIGRYPGVARQKGVHPIIECTQNIPCNPCQDACSRHCIKIGSRITALPAVDPSQSCVDCGLCVAACSGQAIFLVNEDYEPGYATVTLPYEFLPLPAKGDKGFALGRDGQQISEAEVVRVRSLPAFDRTHLLTIRVPADMAMRARFYKAEVAHGN